MNTYSRIIGVDFVICCHVLNWTARPVDYVECLSAKLKENEKKNTRREWMVDRERKKDTALADRICASKNEPMLCFVSFRSVFIIVISIIFALFFVVYYLFISNRNTYSALLEHFVPCVEREWNWVKQCATPHNDEICTTSMLLIHLLGWLAFFFIFLLLSTAICSYRASHRVYWIELRCVLYFLVLEIPTSFIATQFRFDLILIWIWILCLCWILCVAQ